MTDEKCGLEEDAAIDAEMGRVGIGLCGAGTAAVHQGPTACEMRVDAIEKDIEIIKNALAGFFESQNQIQSIIGFAMDTLATHGLITNVTPDEEKASWAIGDGKALLEAMKKNT